MKELPEVGKTRLAEYKAIRPLLREEYHMIWRSPQDLNPECCFDYGHKKSHGVRGIKEIYGL